MLCIFTLDTPIKKVSTTRKPDIAPKPTRPLTGRMRAVREKNLVPQLGDKVCVALSEMSLKEAQRGHGGWSMRMKEVSAESR